MVPAGGLLVELGVAGGRHAVQLLKRHDTLRYLGIDAWEVRPHDMKLAMRRLRPFAERVTLRRCLFSEATQDVCNADLVYVDGFAHTGQDGGATLREWWPMVRPGGIMAGHDYDPVWPLTVKAVDEWAAHVGCPVHIIPDRPYPTWWLRKPVP